MFVESLAGNMKVALFLAGKSIARGNKWALGLTIAVMSLSFVNLIFTSSILSGVTTTMDEQLVDTTLANIIISPAEDRYYMEKASQVEARIRQVEGVAGVAAHLNSSAFIEHEWKEKQRQTDRGSSGTWEVIGIDPIQEASVTVIHSSIIEGSYLSEHDRDEIVVGIEIAGGDGAQSSEFLTLGGVKVGDELRLTYPNGVQREYTVKGIFRAREIMRADHLAFVTRQEMASVLGRDIFFDRATEILVSTLPGADDGLLIEEFKAMGIAGEIRNWREYGGAMRGTIATFEIIASLIGAIGLVVAAIVMFIVIYIAVLNRRRQIGILRAIGIRKSNIIASYLMQALLYASSGIGLGWLVVNFLMQPYFAYHPLDLPMGLVSLNVQLSTIWNSVAGLIAAAVLAGLIPAAAIMKQGIVKTIWGV